MLNTIIHFESGNSKQIHQGRTPGGGNRKLAPAACCDVSHPIFQHRRYYQLPHFGLGKAMIWKTTLGRLLERNFSLLKGTLAILVSAMET